MKTIEQRNKPYSDYRIALLQRLILIVQGKEEKPSWQGTNYHDGWRGLLENLSILLGRWNAWDGCDYKLIERLLDEDPISLIKQAINCLDDEQKVLFSGFCS